MNKEVELLEEITTHCKEWWGRNLPDGWEHKFIAYVSTSNETYCADCVTHGGEKVADVITKTSQWNSVCDPVTECEVVEDAMPLLCSIAKSENTVVK